MAKRSKYTWQYNKMIALARKLDFETIDEYYQYIISSKVNGNISQCIRLFKSMPKENRKEFLSYLADTNWRFSDKQTEYEVLKLLIEEI